jgi:hypothetical protein
MGVSRLDNIALLTGLTGNTTGNPSAQEQPYIGPVNVIATVIATGTFAGGTLTLEIFDGTNWVPAGFLTPASLTGAGAITFQGASLGIRCKVTGAGAANLNAKLILADMS